MLGVRRTSVTDVASKMQAVGAISYSRGVIKVIDLGKLRNMSCECYETLRENTGQALLAPDARSDLHGLPPSSPARGGGEPSRTAALAEQKVSGRN